jgi:galactokinase
MSSSAALECATIYSLNEIFDLGLDKLTMVKLAQRSENEFVGVKCGIMDQFASMYGRKEHAIRLDCQSLEYEYVPFNMDGIRIVLFDTRVKHSLASSEYNLRRQQCEAGVKLVKAHHPDVNSLRDVTPDMLARYIAPADPIIYKRCRYVVEENARLLAACEDLRQGNIAAFGRKMFATHEGLSVLYQVSCAELDFLVEHVKDHPAVLGARMMGGGFGGCTINLVREEAIGELVAHTVTAYAKAMNKELKVYKGQIENGTSRLSQGIVNHQKQ